LVTIKLIKHYGWGSVIQQGKDIFRLNIPKGVVEDFRLSGGDKFYFMLVGREDLPPRVLLLYYTPEATKLEEMKELLVKQGYASLTFSISKELARKLFRQKEE